MLDPKTLPLETIRRLPPLIIGHIRWEKAIGNPTGGPCSGFRILVEEHTTTEFRIGPDGIAEPEPGTGIWKFVTDTLPCTVVPNTDGTHEVLFRVTQVHYTSYPDGMYRVKPQLIGAWHNPIAPASPGVRRIEPAFQDVVLTESASIRSVDFEVIWFALPSQAEWRTRRSRASS